MYLLPENYVNRWQDSVVIVAGSGEGLTPEVAYLCRHQYAIAVNDAHLRMPYAQVLYAADSDWWDVHKGAPDFTGERWSILEDITPELYTRKLQVAEKYGIKVLRGSMQEHFSHDYEFITYGANSGFQAINLAMHFGARRILLVGFNMSGKHFFGDHPAPLRNGDPSSFIKYFVAAIENWCVDTPIINCTPDSELKCFRYMTLEEALALP